METFKKVLMAGDAACLLGMITTHKICFALGALMIAITLLVIEIAGMKD